MQNFECFGGPLNGFRFPCEFAPYEGARKTVIGFYGELKREVFYELRRHKTVELITGDGIWQWFFVNDKEVNMDIQRLRNLTTGILHTTVDDVYVDIETLTGAAGVLTHQIPAAIRALNPFLRAHVHNPRFFDGKLDASHTGQIDIRPMDGAAQEAFWSIFRG